MIVNFHIADIEMIFTPILVADGEDTSGPAEPVMIKEMDGGDRPPVSKVTIEDFDLLKVLGKGSFGKVMMVRKKDTKKIYAMKTLRKAALVKRNQVQPNKSFLLFQFSWLLVVDTSHENREEYTADNKVSFFDKSDICFSGRDTLSTCNFAWMNQSFFFLDT